MKFIELGSYDDNTLKELKEVVPLDFAKKTSIKRLNFNLGFIKKVKSEIYDSYVENLEKNYAKLKKTDFLSKRNFDISAIIVEFENLKNYKTLVENSFNYFLSLLELSIDDNWEEDKLDVTQRNYFRSLYVPNYHNLVSLSDTIGKDEAIKLYKRFVTEYVNFQYDNSKYRYETLEEQREDEIRDFKENPYPGWLRIESTVENGKLFHRRETCLLAESIKDLPDKDFRFLVACYKDYQSIKLYWNKHFILTMKHNIAKGDPYCSCAYHDTRLNWDITHPPDEFWESMWPLREWQKKMIEP